MCACVRSWLLVCPTQYVTFLTPPLGQMREQEFLQDQAIVQCYRVLSGVYFTGIFEQILKSTCVVLIAMMLVLN